MLVQNLDKSDVVLTTDSSSLCYRNRVCVFIESQREMTLLVFSATVTMSIEKKKKKTDDEGEGCSLQPNVNSQRKFDYSHSRNQLDL